MIRQYISYVRLRYTLDENHTSDVKNKSFNRIMFKVLVSENFSNHKRDQQRLPYIRQCNKLLFMYTFCFDCQLRIVSRFKKMSLM